MKVEGREADKFKAKNLSISEQSECDKKLKGEGKDFQPSLIQERDDSGTVQKHHVQQGTDFIPLNQWSPTFWAPGTGFEEDHFSSDGGGGEWMVPGCNVSDGRQQMKLHWLARRSPPAVRPGS